jgi:hypothetical protein
VICMSCAPTRHVSSASVVLILAVTMSFLLHVGVQYGGV